jgi:hypothetical protein
MPCIVIWDIKSGVWVEDIYTGTKKKQTSGGQDDPLDLMWPSVI